MTSNNKEGLTDEEFVDGFFKLYIATFQETSKIIFNLLDFYKDGVIKKEDVKLILSYLPLNNVDEEKNQVSIKVMMF
jgi:Ca2+-binding EF-hand superfamily protein